MGLRWKIEFFSSLLEIFNLAKKSVSGKAKKLSRWNQWRTKENKETLENFPWWLCIWNWNYSDIFHFSTRWTQPQVFNYANKTNLRYKLINNIVKRKSGGETNFLDWLNFKYFINYSNICNPKLPVCFSISAVHIAFELKTQKFNLIFSFYSATRLLPCAET